MAEDKAPGGVPSKSAAEDKSKERKTNGTGRPSIIPLTYPDKESLQKAYMPFAKGGGLFFTTNTFYEMNEEVFLLVTLPNGKEALPVPGVVVWRTPSAAMDARRQGVGIEFKGKEGNGLRNRIEGTLGPKLSSADPTFTM